MANPNELKEKTMKPCEKGLAMFTQRQVDIIKCASEGKRMKDIADTLGITVWTVRSDIQLIYKSTPAMSLAHAVALLYGIE